MKKKIIYERLPQFIKAILVQSYGWLVGSTPEAFLNGAAIIKDYDILVEDKNLYQDVVKMLSASGFQHEFNSFGGNKFTNDKFEIDIWCEDLGHFLQNSTQAGYIYHLRRSRILQIW